MDGEISENKAGFIDIIKDYTVVFSKSQLPEIRIKRAAAMTEIRRKYNELCGVDLNERRLAKKLINMKSRLKIKIDMLRKENKPVLLKDYEKKLLDLMQGEKHKSRIGMEEAAVALFGGQTTSAAIDSPEVADTAQEASVFLPEEEIIPGPSTPGSPEERQDEFKFDNYETEVTWNLSINELKRYVLLKQLRVLEMKEQQILKKNRVLDLEEEKLLWEREKRLHQVEHVKAEPGSSQKDWLWQKEVEDQMLRRKLEIREAEKVKIDQRAENRRLYSRLHTERREAEAEEKIIQANNAYTLRQAQYEQEAKLAQEVDRIQREEIKEMKLRQKLRETSTELKQLEAQLRSAYVSKELAAQLAEKEAAKLKEKLDEKKAAEFMRSIWEKADAIEAEKEVVEYQQKLAYRAELQDQMICGEKRKQIAYEDFLREKLLLDEVIRRIHEEDQREMEARMIKMNKTKEEIEAFNKAREIWKQKEKEGLEEENRRIQEYIANQDEKEHERMEQQRKREEQKAINTERIARKMYEEEVKKREEEEVILQLLEEERKDKMAREEQAEIERQIRQRIETQQVYRNQMKEKMERLKKEADEEAMFRKQLLEQFAESERLEQLTAERRRIKMLEHRRAVSEILDARRKQRAEELEYLMRMQELEKQEEKARIKLIEDERLRMLKEHAVKLIGYLPRGVLRQDDLPHLGSEFLEKCNSGSEITPKLI